MDSLWQLNQRLIEEIWIAQPAEWRWRWSRWKSYYGSSVETYLFEVCAVGIFPSRTLINGHFTCLKLRKLISWRIFNRAHLSQLLEISQFVLCMVQRMKTISYFDPTVLLSLKQSCNETGYEARIETFSQYGTNSFKTEKEETIIITT